jgi:hypothetical protein
MYYDAGEQNIKHPIELRLYRVELQPEYGMG